MYRLFGNVPVGRADETQMSADRMAIENRKKARENQENIKRGEKRRTTKAPVGAKAARSGKKWSPGLCMARREFLLYSRARRFAAPCRVGYETGGKLRKAAVESSSGKRQRNGLFQSSAPPQIRPVAEILGRGEQVAGCVHQFRSLRARPLLNGRRVAAGRSRRSGTVGNIR